MKISLPYGDGNKEIDISDERLVAVMQGSLDDFNPCKSGEQLVREAMDSPIGSERLSELAKGKQKVVIIASDHTRPVPSKIIMPAMLSEIRKGNPDADITILIATGCHRGTRREELLAKFGEDIYNNEKIIVHDAFDEKELVSIGTLPSGGELKINRTAAEADLLVAEGFIEPHFFAGFSGGRKSVLPGIASREAVYHNHNAQFIDDENARMGIIDGNPLHADMIFAARAAKLMFIVNVVINSEKKTITAFAGDCDKAHRAGCEFVRRMCANAPVQADIVITTNNGYPMDQNIYQAVKGMCTAEATCRVGGVIIAVAECRDGTGGEAFYRTFCDERNPEKILQTIRSRTAEQTVPDQWQSQVYARILSKFTVILVSSVEDRLVRDMQMIPAKTVEDAIAIADRILGDDDANICVIPEGISTMICPSSELASLLQH